jgi:hypothetical protein
MRIGVVIAIYANDSTMVLWGNRAKDYVHVSIKVQLSWYGYIVVEHGRCKRGLRMTRRLSDTDLVAD